MTAAASGAVGSTQWRRQAASTTRPKRKPASNQSTKSGSSRASSSIALSMARQAGSIIRARLSRPRRAPSMRARSPAARVSAFLVQNVFELAGQRQERRLDGAERLRGVPGGGPDLVQSGPRGALHADLRRRGAGSQLFQNRVRKTSIGPRGLASPAPEEGPGAMRDASLRRGSAAAARAASSKAARASSRSPSTSMRRSSRPRPRRPRPSGPRIQRRISAASAPDKAAENALSAASNR